ncbi:MAG: diaminobutyrate acetyltransferase [Burkholderiales bacterium]
MSNTEAVTSSKPRANPVAAPAHCADAIELSTPCAADAPAVHQLIAQCKPLDLNSTYAYLLLCHHFSDTCVIARMGKEVVGFISGYLLPADKQTFFVWQVAVHQRARGAQLGVRMLEHLMKRKGIGATARFMETTVSPSNKASRRMFQRFADQNSASVKEQMLFDRTAFGNEEHEEEVLLKIGPFETGR